MVYIAVLCRRHDLSVKILLGHRNRSVHEISESVCEIGVIALDQRFVCDRAVRADRHFAEQVIPCTVNAERINNIVGVDNVSARLAHLVLAEKYPVVTEKLLRNGKSECVKHDRPVNRVESHNILTDNVAVARPVLLEKLGRTVGVVAECGDIVRERVYPYINNVLGVECNGNAPCKSGTRNAEILKSRFNEVVEHFLLSAFGNDKIGVLLDVILEPLLILG